MADWIPIFILVGVFGLVPFLMFEKVTQWLHPLAKWLVREPKLAWPEVKLTDHQPDPVATYLWEQYPELNPDYFNPPPKPPLTKNFFDSTVRDYQRSQVAQRTRTYCLGKHPKQMVCGSNCVNIHHFNGG